MQKDFQILKKLKNLTYISCFNMNSEASYMILEMNTVNVILTVNRATIVKFSANQMNFFIEIQYNFKIIYTQ